MPLDEATEKFYRAADTSTLLGLLPLLQSEIERATVNLENAERHREYSADTDARIGETYGEALATFRVQVGDDPDARDALRDLRDKVNSMLGGLRAHDDLTAQHIEDLFRYLVDLTERKRWIVQEMKRRGYLPLFASEEPLH